MSLNPASKVSGHCVRGKRVDAAKFLTHYTVHFITTHDHLHQHNYK